MSKKATCCAECTHYIEGNLMPEACGCDKPYCEPIKKPIISGYVCKHNLIACELCRQIYYSDYESCLSALKTSKTNTEGKP